MKGFYITSSGNRFELDPEENIDVVQRDITKIVLPQTWKKITCNSLTELVLHE